MITVADIIALPAFHKVEVLQGGGDALTREVRNVGIMDTSPDEDCYSDYLPGEFIVSNLGFARNDPKAAEEALVAMVSRNLAALAIRNINDVPIPESALEASRKSGTPLLLYEGEYYEVVIYQSLQLLEQDKSDSGIGRIIDRLLKNNSPETIRGIFYDAVKATGATIQCAALQPLGGDEASLYAQIGELSGMAEYIKESWPRVETATVFRYHDNALVLVTYDRPPATFSLESDSDFIRLLQPHGRFLCGISEEVPLGEGDLAVREAFAALGHAAAQSQPIVRWAAMGREAFRRAAITDRLISSTCDLYQQMISDSEKRGSAELLATARAYAEACGDVRAAADALFQHPNTVRYRLKKLKAIFNMEDCSDRELARFLMLVFLV